MLVQQNPFKYSINVLLDFHRFWFRCKFLFDELWYRNVAETMDLTKLGGRLGSDHLPPPLQLIHVLHLPGPDHQLGLE